ncbi:MAG: Gfo/Idh/MocA family oxidoreductase [Lacisediminihabitans sp.]
MLTVGIIGAGLRGRLFTEALREVPGVFVAGFAEPSDRVAEAAMKATGLPVVSTHRNLLADLDPDAIIVATPDLAHREFDLDDVRAQHPSTVVVDLGWPGDDRRYADLATFGASRHVGQALLAWLEGQRSDRAAQ